MDASALPSVPTDCLRCGVCCFSTLPTYVPVTGDDWQRLGPDADTWAHFIGHRAFLRLSDGHCAALSIRLEPSTGARIYFCQIYDRRPHTCRELERGSPACLGELSAKVARPPQTRADGRT